MKILIVDDNIAIQEIIAEILGVEGNNVAKAGSIEEALEKIDDFDPDALILDSEVDGESGLRVLDAIDPDSGVRAIILTKGNEIVPKDTKLIKGCIKKPFRSDDITTLVREIEKDAASKKSKRRKSLLGGIFAKHGRFGGGDDIPGIRFGKSYVIFESEPASVYKLAWNFMMKDCDVIVVTTGKVKSISERFRNDEDRKVEPLGLSPKARQGYVEITKLGTVMDRIKGFVETKDKPVIVFDNMEPIINANGLNNVMTMLYQIIGGVGKKTSTLIVSTGEDSLTDKDKDLFLHDMERYMG